MGILLCEQNFRDVWRRNKIVRAEIGNILRTHTHTHTHTRGSISSKDDAYSNRTSGERVSLLIIETRQVTRATHVRTRVLPTG